MKIKSLIINKLEKEIETSAGHIELENLTEEDREKMFQSRKPFMFDLKKRLLSYLRGTKQIGENTKVGLIQKDKRKSWEIPKNKRIIMQKPKELIGTNKNNKELYEESIILIGPSGAGKSTIAEELRKRTGMQRLCLDKIANRARDNGVMDKFKNADEFNLYLISETLERAKKEGLHGIVDFGAGHSVYEDREIFKRVKLMLKPFKNVILLIPDKDEEKSLEIMKRRSTGDTRDNKKFIESPCNGELANMIIYGNNRQPSVIAEEIMQCIKQRKKQQMEIE